MIIKVTVEDNDFGEILERFMKNLCFELTREPDDLTAGKALDFYRTYKRINSLLNPNVTEKLTEEDVAFLTERIKKSWEFYVKKKVPDADQYLVNKFKVTFPKTFTDKWENGEAVYWFQHSGIVLNQ